MERPAAAPAAEDWWWIFDPRLSLRARALLIVGGASVLFAALLVWLSGALFQRQLESQLGRSFELQATQVVDKLDRHLYERLREIQFLAMLAPFRSPDTPVAEQRRLLEGIVDPSPDFLWAGFADVRGTVVSATHGVFQNSSAADLAWFRSAREQPYVGRVRDFPELTRQLAVADSEGAVRVIDLAVPVLGPQGEFLGVLAATLRWPAWGRSIQLSVVPETATRERLGVTVYDPTGDVLLDSGGSGWTDPPAAPASAGRRGTLREPTPMGTTYVTGYIRSRGYRDFRGLGWLVTVRQPVELAFAPVRDLRRSIARWGVVFGVALVVVSWVAAGRVARRLRAVTAAARRIQGGDVLATMPRPAGESEMAKMCGAVGDLVDDLRARGEKPVEEQPPASLKHPW